MNRTLPGRSTQNSHCPSRDLPAWLTAQPCASLPRDAPALGMPARAAMQRHALRKVKSRPYLRSRAGDWQAGYGYNRAPRRVRRTR
jgi:hypothetical protein